MYKNLISKILHSASKQSKFVSAPMILIGFVPQTWGRLLSVCALPDRRADCLDLAKVEKSSWTT